MGFRWRRWKEIVLHLRIESRRCTHTTYQILLLQGFSMYKSMFSFNMAEVLYMKQMNKSISAVFVIKSPSNRASKFFSMIWLLHIQYLSLWVSAKDLGPTFHWGIVIEVLLDLLHCMRTPIVWGVSRQSYGEKTHPRIVVNIKIQPLNSCSLIWNRNYYLVWCIICIMQNMF